MLGLVLAFESGSHYRVIELIEDVVTVKNLDNQAIVAYKVNYLNQLLSQQVCRKVT